MPLIWLLTSLEFRTGGPASWCPEARALIRRSRPAGSLKHYAAAEHIPGVIED